MTTVFGLTVFDWTAICLLIFMFVMGYFRGFMKELVHAINVIGSYILAKIGATALSPMVMEKLGIGEKFRNYIGDMVSEIDLSSVGAVREGLSEAIKEVEGIGSLLDNLPLDTFEMTKLIQNNKGKDIATELGDLLYKQIEPLISQFCYTATFVVCFFVMLLVVGLVLSLMSSVFESINFVGSLNGLLGGVIGIVKGVVIIASVYSMIYVLLTVSNSELLDTFVISKTFGLVGNIKNYILVLQG